MIQASDLLAPAGEIELKMFPGEDQTTVLARLDSFVADGEERSGGNDDGTRSWAYYRAYKAVLSRIASAPMHVNILSESEAGYDRSQILALERLMQNHLNDFYAAVGKDPKDSRNVQQQASSAVRTVFVF